MNRLSDDELNKVSAGYVFDATHIPGADPERPWQIIDEKGNVISTGGFISRQQAQLMAAGMLQSIEEIDYDRLMQLRGLK